MQLNSTRMLNNGVAMPWLGYGVFRMDDNSATERAVLWALEAGFRHIDTAAIYGNERAVGNAIRSFGLPREGLFITTKLWNEDMRSGKQMEAFERSLVRLGLDYVDLYLIHWPVEGFERSWEMLEAIQKSGRARAIGVSNFTTQNLDTLLARGGVTPAVNQVESHPYLAQKGLLEYCVGKGIACQAWGPLGGQGAPLLNDPVVAEIARKHDVTPAQVILRWDLQRGVTPLVKSADRERIRINTQLYGFALDKNDMDELDFLDRYQRFGPDPNNFDF